MKYQELEKIPGFILYPMMFGSCVLFPLSVVPPQFRHILLWNPIVHTVEGLRQALFPEAYQVPEVNLIYPTLAALVAMTIGLVTYQNNYHFLKQR